MSQDAKKKIKVPPWLSYVLIGLEVALMIGLVVIAFLTMDAANKGTGSGMIKWLITNQVWFFMLIVFPLIVLFLLNVYLLIKVMNDSSQKEHAALTKEELLAEALKVMSEASQKESKTLSQEELLAEARRQAREELELELAKQKETPKE